MSEDLLPNAFDATAEPAAVAQDAPEADPAPEVAPEVEAAPEVVAEAFEPLPVEEAPVEQAPVEPPAEEAPAEEVIEIVEDIKVYVNHNALNGVQAGPAPHPRTA